MRWSLPVLLLTSGCHVLFSVDGIRSDEVADASVNDAPDAGDCTGSGSDEDGDGLPDSCDPCPISDINTGDQDQDGVVDDCDPDPASPQRVLLFDGFNTIGPYTFDGSATIANGAWTASGVDSHALLWSPPPAVGTVWIIAGVSVSALEAGETYRELGAIFHGASPTTQANGTHCVLGRQGTSDYVEIYVRDRPDPDVHIADGNPGMRVDQLVDGQLRAFSSTETPTITFCRFSAAGLGSQVMSTHPASAEMQVGLYALNLSASFRYLLVLGPG